MTTRLTQCIRDLLAAIQQGRGEDVGKHLKHVVILLTAYVSGKLAESLDHDEPITFGTSPEHQELLAAAASLSQELGDDEPQTFSGPFTDWILMTLVNVLISKLSDSEFVDEFVIANLDALVKQLEELLGV